MSSEAPSVDAQLENVLLQLSTWDYQDVILALARLARRSKEELVSEVMPQIKPLAVPKFDFYTLPACKIAVRINYDGRYFQGLAMQNRESSLFTVENLLFRALQTNFMLPQNIEPQVVQFSRCGRTDAGVSGCGQVISFWIRAKSSPITFNNLKARLIAKKEHQQAGKEDDQKTNAFNVTPHACEHPEWALKNNINYVEVINKSLPLAIRCTGVAFVAEDFDARFAAKARAYRYFLPIEAVNGLSPAQVEDLAQIFVGEHDFRNLCQQKPEVKNYVRTVF